MTTKTSPLFVRETCDVRLSTVHAAYNIEYILFPSSLQNATFLRGLFDVGVAKARSHVHLED